MTDVRIREDSIMTSVSISVGDLRLIHKALRAFRLPKIAEEKQVLSIERMILSVLEGENVKLD